MVQNNLKGSWLRFDIPLVIFSGGHEYLISSSIYTISAVFTICSSFVHGYRTFSARTNSRIGLVGLFVVEAESSVNQMRIAKQYNWVDGTHLTLSVLSYVLISG